MTTYERAGIRDVGAFYAAKFLDTLPPDVLRRVPLARYDVRLVRMRWLLANVRPGARVLDFGCGGGMVGLLAAEKGCEVYGLELSARAAELARSNGYREVFVGDLAAAPFAPASFDHVVSLDVFGHIEFDHKDAVIAQLKRLLRRDGSMLHGIECGPVDYAAMTPAELHAYVAVDGHVGMESEEAIVARWRRQFANVDGIATFAIASDHVTMVKEHKNYGKALPPEVAHYLTSLTPEEGLAFDMAMGLVAERILGGPLAPHEHGGFCLLRASDAPLPPRADPPPGPPPQELAPGDQLDFFDVAFLKGWHDPERAGPGWMRWSSTDALLQLRLAPRVTALRCTLRVPAGPLPRDVWFLHGDAERPAHTVSLQDRDATTITVPVAGPELGLRIVSNGFLVPAYGQGNPDRRRLSLCWTKIEAV